MTQKEQRQEQIEQATVDYINGRIRNNVPPEEIEEIRLAFQAGMICADEHPIEYDGKAMLHVLNKGHDQGWKDAVRKASLFVYHLGAHPNVTIDGLELEKSFKEYMEKHDTRR